MRTTATALLAGLALTACGDAATGSDAEAPVVSRTEAPDAPMAAAEAAAPAAAAAQTAEATPVPEGSLSATEMSLGDENAPLTVIEYASTTCPGCAGFHAQVFPLIKEELIETGQVRFVFREFPTAPANLSIAASMLARCAASDRGAPAYFAALDALYQRQRDWAFSADPRQALEGIFGQVGMDQAAIRACLNRPDVFQKIQSNIADAKAIGVDRTPTLVIDGEIIEFGGSAEEIVEDLRARAEAKG